MDIIENNLDFLYNVHVFILWYKIAEQVLPGAFIFLSYDKVDGK